MRRFVALLAVLFILALAGCGENRAASVRLTGTEGTVAISDHKGGAVEPREDLPLYGGYGVETASASYAWMNLDDVKLAKMDQDSEISIQKTGKELEIQVETGSFFFHVLEPLGEDESMTIRSGSMAVGIRGTCGWVRVDRQMAVYILEGTVACTVGDGEAVSVTAGEMALLDESGEITKRTFTRAEVPAFVAGETEEPLLAALESGGEPPDTTPDTPNGAAASGECMWGLAWSLTGDGVLTISGTGSMEAFTLAGDRDGPWFAEGLPAVRTVVLEEGVKNVGAAAFRDCETLTEIILPASVVSIDAAAFAGCTALDHLPSLDHVEEIRENAFRGCRLLSDLSIPANVRKLGGFGGCTGLSAVTVPEGVEEIGQSAFQDCTGLSEIHLPRSLTFIGREAFEGCDSLKDVYYPGTEAEFRADVWFEYIMDDSIKYAAFHFGGSVNQQDRPAGGAGEPAEGGAGGTGAIAASGEGAETAWTLSEDGVLTISGSGRMDNFDYNRPFGWLAEGLPAVRRVLIQEGVTSVGSESFRRCGELTDITIPEGVTDIYGLAFGQCAALTEVTIPASVTKIWNSAFSGCSGLTRVTLSAGVGEIGAGAFSRCNLAEVYFYGTPEEFGALEIGEDNDALLSAAMTYIQN